MEPIRIVSLSAGMMELGTLTDAPTEKAISANTVSIIIIFVFDEWAENMIIE